MGWALALFASTIYLLTLAPTVSFWDCGEFITTNYQLSIGHPPGAPLYQLLAHAFTWLAGGNPLLVARFSNALSAIAAGLTVMFLYWILLLLFPKPSTLKAHAAAVIGALCYLFCDTAWFSAVESEVYALAVLFAAMTLWAMLRWYAAAGIDLSRSLSRRSSQSPAHLSLFSLPVLPSSRWLFLVALLLGLGLCVHLLTLLVAPALLLIFIFRFLPQRRSKKLSSSNPSVKKLANLHRPHLSSLPFFALLPFFFLLGLSPYLLIPIRATADPPINFIRPATSQNIKRYLSREQYEHAPLYPRIWRNHPHDQEYAADWSGGNNVSFVGNMRYFFSYQVGYMYLRYLMWNFSGRYNDSRGYGSLLNGQFLTGIPLFDRFVVGSGNTPPHSLTHGTRQVYFLLPLLLGLLGLCHQCSSDKRGFYAVLLLFLVSGLGLAIYLNHPTYEPRERDYAYVLSFFAFAIWIGWGALFLLQQVARWLHHCSSQLRRSCLVLALLLLLAVPSLMASQNWCSHNRSHNFVARDSAINLLNSCDKDALLFTMGDNDTFPLWYVQQVEGLRTDVTVYNINLLGSFQRFFNILKDNASSATSASPRPVFFSHYAYNDLSNVFGDRLQLEGIAYHLFPDSVRSFASLEAAYEKMMHYVLWSPSNDALDEVSYRFLASYWMDVVMLALELADAHQQDKAIALLDNAAAQFPPSRLRDPQQLFDVACCYESVGNTAQALQLRSFLKTQLQEQLTYYYSLPVGYQKIIPFSIRPREEILDILSK